MNKPAQINYKPHQQLFSHSLNNYTPIITINQPQDYNQSCFITTNNYLDDYFQYSSDIDPKYNQQKQQSPFFQLKKVLGGKNRIAYKLIQQPSNQQRENNQRYEMRNDKQKCTSSKDRQVKQLSLEVLRRIRKHSKNRSQEKVNYKIIRPIVFTNNGKYNVNKSPPLTDSISLIPIKYRDQINIKLLDVPTIKKINPKYQNTKIHQENIIQPW